MSFSQQLTGFKKKALDDVNKAKKETLLRLFTAVVKDTPVEDGTLRGNWQLGKGQPITTATDSTKIPSFKGDLDKTDFKDTVYLNNNLPYAYPIEFLGHSKVKAPAGMVRKNVIRLSRIASAVAKGVNNGTI